MTHRLSSNIRKIRLIFRDHDGVEQYNKVISVKGGEEFEIDYLEVE